MRDSDVRGFNRSAWDRQVEGGNPWAVPVSTQEVQAARQGDWHILLTPSKLVPRDWFPDLRGLDVLCLASGGVPRDFLSLFVSLANGSAASGDLIGKMQVNEAAIGNLGSKMESMRRDSGEEDTVLEACLQRIKRYVYEEKRTNAFLIAKEDFEADVRFRQAIRELVDLRLMHLVDHNTSKARSDGRRYEAYILDVSLYDNPRPRSFTQIEPGQQDDRARKDALRASPVFAMQKLTEPLPDIPVQLELILTDE